jgi:hypothetical protein
MEAAIIASGTQIVSSAITNLGSVQKNVDMDNEICGKIDQTKKDIDTMNGLLMTLDQASEIDTKTATLIIQLNSRLAAEKVRMAEETKKFTIKAVVTIIMNIVIVTILFLKLFS